MNLAQSLPLDTWGMHGDVGAGWWIVMMVAMLVFWGAIILGILWLVRGGFPWRRREAAPIEILERRFAEGAISARSTASGARRSYAESAQGRSQPPTPNDRGRPRRPERRRRKA